MNISLLLFLSVAASAFAADHLEIEVRLESTFTSPARTNEYDVTAVCIVGTNDWYISGQFMQNANVEYWLVGKNVIERRTITSSMYLKQAKDVISEKLGTKPPPPFLGLSYPHKGEVRMRTNSWLEPLGHGVERSVWLAFCSGSFLRIPGREIPLPFGLFSQSEGYSDNTVLLGEHSALSLPKTVDLLSADGSLAAHYEVLSSTNIFGSTIPLQFHLTQYRNPRPQDSVQYNLTGTVISIKPCDAPAGPDIKSTP